MGLGDFLKSKESKETKDRSKSSKSSKSQQQKSQTTISALVAPDTKKRVDAKPGADAQGKTPDKQAVFDRQSPNVAKILEVSRGLHYSIWPRPWDAILQERMRKWT